MDFIDKNIKSRIRQWILSYNWGWVDRESLWELRRLCLRVRACVCCRIDTAQSCGSLCKQEGVFRVNCMDCLDRTNVVESLFSKEVLQMAVSSLD